MRKPCLGWEGASSRAWFVGPARFPGTQAGPPGRHRAPVGLVVRPEAAGERRFLVETDERLDLRDHSCDEHHPAEHPLWRSVYHWFRAWRIDGTWERLNAALRERLRVRLGRNSQPSAAIGDSQMIRTTGVGGTERGFGPAK